MKFALAVSFALLVCVAGQHCRDKPCEQGKCCLQKWNWGILNNAGPKCHPLGAVDERCSDEQDENGVYKSFCPCAEGLKCELGDGNKLRCSNPTQGSSTEGGVTE